MPIKDSSQTLGKIRFLFIAIVLVALPQFLQAQTQWTATVGAQSENKGRQALAFLPSEMWIHAGDSITWSFVTDEPHTVTFLTSTQVRPSFDAGCPGFSSSGSPFDGTTCVTTPPLGGGATFTVVFPSAGNFRVACLFHENMEGAIHVLPLSQPVPHDQAFYSNQVKSDHQAMMGHGEMGMNHGATPSVATGNRVIAGIGQVLTTPGGSHTISVMRFMQTKITIHAGDTVQWNNMDPITPHTITFGAIPADVFDPSSNVTVDADGARHVVLNSTTDTVHSGFIQASAQDRLGLVQSPLGVTHFRVTLTQPGVYHYLCALHFPLGMEGTVTVIP